MVYTIASLLALKTLALVGAHLAACAAHVKACDALGCRDWLYGYCRGASWPMRRFV